ncbi:MAG: hypothetical protein E6I57_06100 [Chloroflexi bacterium]|nr:MAG: hypothetical protein E6J49_07850 [Chloroflexota bacterium]TMC29520.1 MAG: hypothetical protein E6J27_05210 [Chloroflexota bacterium]TMC33843.1 MAG: hypothetical protein E6J24_08360 [Chloroflexota bacterium]TME39948.1 MAG: hypothetical protein E6I57_06100 [Chloroflexota bacterium]
MLRQIARLTRPVEDAGPRATAIAVYADAADRVVPATDFGFEGVACVDDAARGAVLLCDLWAVTRVPIVRAWALGIADFLHYMQRQDGSFVNFVVDWRGHHNENGPTSYPGGSFWQARGTRALAKLWMVLGDERAHDALLRAVPLIREATDVPPDVRAIHVHMANELLRVGAMSQLRADLERWCEEIVRLRRGRVLYDNPDQDAPHLWGHVQEGAIAEAGGLLDRPDFVSAARESAMAYLAPLVERGFDEPTVQPYGVASAIYSLTKLLEVTGDEVFADLVAKARDWFYGRNPARRQVYDRESGRVNDGIDDGLLNEHSGAESNIVAAQALIDDVVATLPDMLPLIEGCFVPRVRERLLAAPAAGSA